MKFLTSMRKIVLALAVAGMLAPQMAGAAEQVNQAPAVADVSLYQGGVFLGQVVNRQGKAKAGVEVVLSQKSAVVAVAKTDAKGRFVVRGVRAGVYQVQVDKSAAVYRLWAPNTAPPAANTAALVVSDSSIALGQGEGGIGLGGAAMIGLGAAGGVIIWGATKDDDAS